MLQLLSDGICLPCISTTPDDASKLASVCFEQVTHYDYDNLAVQLLVDRCEKSMWQLVEETTNVFEYLNENVSSDPEQFLPTHFKPLKY